MRSSFGLRSLVAAALFSSGCAYVGEPMPPALNVPRPVAALAIEQVGERIVMRFEPPQQTTEALPLQMRAVDLRVGPVDPAAWPGDAPAVTVNENSGSAGAAPWVGKRVVAAVRVQSKQGKWSAWSPLAPLDVVEPLATPADVKAEAAPRGVRVSWRNPARAGVTMRVERRSGERFSEAGVVEASAGEFFDQQARFGEEQQYRVTALLGATARSETVGTPALTPQDTFAPGVPASLTAVTGLGAVELSWDRPADPDLAGFRIYRDGVRIGPAESVAAATFSDRTIQKGKTYRYTVTAVDQVGNESKPSTPAEITAPD